MSDPVSEARARIDAIDADLLRLIDERAGLAAHAAQGHDPSLETLTLRRMLDLPRQAAGRALVVQVWRELMADAAQRQGPRHLSVWNGKDGSRPQELARQRFGGGAVMTTVAKAEDALAAARTPGGIAVLSLSGDHPWWLRLLAEPRLQIFAALPDLATLGPLAALAVADVTPQPTGADETFWVTDAEGPVPAIEDALARNGVAARLIVQSSGLKLFGLAGFYQRDDQRLANAPGRLSGVVGAGPIPFDM